MDILRRRLLGGTAGLLALTAGGMRAIAEVFTPDPIPPLPKSPTPGKPGDFDFLSGEWRIARRHRSGVAGSSRGTRRAR